MKDLRLGMTYDEVVRILGEPSQILGEPSQKRVRSPTTINYWPQGVAVHFNPDAEFIEIARSGTCQQE